MEPYVFSFRTFAKGRWIGKTLLDVYKSEFKAYSEDYYVRIMVFISTYGIEICD